MIASLHANFSFFSYWLEPIVAFQRHSPKLSVYTVQITNKYSNKVTFAIITRTLFRYFINKQINQVELRISSNYLLFNIVFIPSNTLNHQLGVIYLFILLYFCSHGNVMPICETFFIIHFVLFFPSRCFNRSKFSVDSLYYDWVFRKITCSHPWRAFASLITA